MNFFGDPFSWFLGKVLKTVFEAIDYETIGDELDKLNDLIMASGKRNID